MQTAKITNGKLEVALVENGREIAKVSMWLSMSPHTHEVTFSGGVFLPDVDQLVASAFKLHRWCKDGHCRICSERLQHGEVICEHHETQPMDERWD